MRSNNKKETVNQNTGAGSRRKQDIGAKTKIMAEQGMNPNGKARTGTEERTACSISNKCGGCQFIDMPYEMQLEKKQAYIDDLLSAYGSGEQIVGMRNPYHYRHKVHAVFHWKKSGDIISGVYEEGTHHVLPVTSCLIEHQKADEIIGTVRDLLKSFKITVYNENSGYGLLRHVMIRMGYATGEIMVILVTAGVVFPSKQNFVKALRRVHPEITTIVQNINERQTSMVLGDRDVVMYGRGYIEDYICKRRFRISPRSFYQVNPEQTERLYTKAVEYAGLTGNEVILDAYCGIGTIGMIAGEQAKEVIAVELNKEAVRDARINARLNGMKNITFYQNDAGKFMSGLSEQGKQVDVVFMDPPRSGSDEAFLSSVLKLAPKKIVYISCGPETLARDLQFLTKKGSYRVERFGAVDMFPFTGHVETVVLMSRVKD